MGWQESAKDWVLSPGTIQSLGTVVGTVAGGVAGGPAGAALGTTAGSAVGTLAEGITKSAIAASSPTPVAAGAGVAAEVAVKSTVPDGVVPPRESDSPAYGTTVDGRILAVVRDDDGVEWLQLPQPIGVREATLVRIHLQYRKGGRTRRLRFPDED